jgi:hypothetical protein
MYLDSFSSVPLVFYTAGTEKARITSAGKVGIANTSPDYNLSVGTPGTTAASYIQLGSTTTGTGNIFFGDTTGTGAASYRGYLQYDHNVDAMILGTSATERARFTSAGTFYVGSAVDSGAISTYVTGYNGFAAQVSNNAYFTYSGLNASGTRTLAITGAGTLTVSGDVVAYGTPSDIRYKHDIHRITNALNTIQQLRGVTFKWKEDTDSYKMTNITDDIGFIAQEVREVLPTIVRENEDGKLSLRDRAIIPLLVEAIKELKKEVDELKKGKTE